MQFYEMNICQVMIFRLYTAYNKHEMIKIGSKNQRKISSIMEGARIILLSTAFINVTNRKILSAAFE